MAELSRSQAQNLSCPKVAEPKPAGESMSWVAGVDGFKSQWCVVLMHVDTGALRARVIPCFSGLLDMPEQPEVITVDMPVGLPEITPPGGRKCEKEARLILRNKTSSVFSAVGRRALSRPSRRDVDRASREAGGIGVGAQAWGLANKLREVDAVMTPERQELIFEVHPEISFWAMNNRTPVAHGKKSAKGATGRLHALVNVGFPQQALNELLLNTRVGRDDLLDACAAVWTAKRILRKRAERLPGAADYDMRGLDQAIWF